MLNALKNVTYTENMAVSNKSTNSKVLDFYYHAPARRGQDNRQLFLDSLNENELLTIKALFYLRDVRHGKGERETFRQLLVTLWNRNQDLFNALIPIVAEYGRWDDLLQFWANENVVRFVKTQLMSDRFSDTPSLLGKWLPSQNASSSKTIELANHWIRALETTPRNYRKVLSSIRLKLNVVEVKMSQNNWGEINYSHVPSKANVNYRKAFSRHDPEGYTKFIGDAKTGKVKINSSVLYPYEIMCKAQYEEDETLDALWKQLPDYTAGKTAIVVADVSGSMLTSKSKVRPIDVSVSLALYFADKNKGPFSNHFITFTGNPQLHEIKGETLHEKYSSIVQAEWEQNTNIQAVFDLVLSVGKRNHVIQEEMPEVIFIVSDMQFDAATPRNDKTNFEVIQEKYQSTGYIMPTLVFWNVDSRVNETPVTQNERGVFLVSGCSSEVFKKALTLKVDNPYDFMIETLNSERYAPVEEVYESYLMKGY